MTSVLRLEDISLHNYIKYELLGVKFVDIALELPFVYRNNRIYPDTSNFDPDPLSLGRGIVVFNDTLVGGEYIADVTAEQNVKLGLDWGTATVNYLTGELTGLTEPESATWVSFYYYYVSVLDAWPGKDPPPLPIVSIDITATSPEALQLGGGVRHSRSVVLDVFAKNRAERDEITDYLVSELNNKTITVKDYSQGDYLNYSGTYNSSFDHTPVETSPIHIIDVSARFLGADVAWDVMNKYRSRIDVYYESISEST